MRRFTQLCVCAVFFGALCAAPAQDMGPSAPDQAPHQDSTPKETHSETRRHSWFHEPKKKTPAEQLAYADELLKLGKENDARKQYAALVYEWQAAPEAATAQAAYASLLEKAGKYDSAFEEYQYLMEHYVGHFVFEEVLQKQFAIANVVRTQKHWTFWGLSKGTETPERSLDLFEQITKNSPGWERTAEARFYIAAIQEKRGNFEEAADDYGMVVLRSRRSSLAPDASFGRGRCLYLAVKHRPRDEAGYREALSALTIFIRDFPTHPGVETATAYVDELKEKLATMYYEIAQFYDQICHKNEASVLAYTDFIRNFPSSELSVTAHRRIEELEAAGVAKP